jgi:hypothetical protein
MLITTYPLFPIELREKTQLGIFKFCRSPFGVVFFCLQYLKEVLQGLIDNFNKSIKKAEVHRKSASAKKENCKIEYAKGEKHTYEDATKQLTKALGKF